MGKHKNRKLYILSNADRYELPIMVADSTEISEYVGVSQDVVNRAKRTGRKIKGRYLVFNYEGDNQEDL